MTEAILPGTVFNRWTVLNRENNQHGKRFFRCRCQCGTVKTVPLQNLKRGLSRSCGCYRDELPKFCLPAAPKKTLGEGAARHLYIVYQRNASKRNLEFSLTFEEFKALTAGNCAYCGSNPSTIHRQNRSNGDYVHNGIDRVNNSIGYVSSNSVTCCRMCNVAKNTHSLAEFKLWASKLAQHLLK